MSSPSYEFMCSRACSRIHDHCDAVGAADHCEELQATKRIDHVPLLMHTCRGGCGHHASCLLLTPVSALVKFRLVFQPQQRWMTGTRGSGWTFVYCCPARLHGLASLGIFSPRRFPVFGVEVPVFFRFRKCATAGASASQSGHCAV